MENKRKSKDQFKVNILNRRNKEVFRYCETIQQAQNLQRIAEDNHALSSTIWQRDGLGWKSVNKN